MRSDLEVITKQYPHEWDVLRLYAIGDVHVGAENFDERAVRKKLDIIKEDPQGVLCVCGDLGDFGLKNSKTNVYHATMQPKEQIEYIYELFKPIAAKIVSVVPGNHEDRISRDVDLDVLYDLCVRWGVQDVYRENVAIVKLLFGSLRGDAQQNCFIGITTHGSSRNKHKKFIAGFDGIDFAISGHTHTPEYSPQGKIRVNSRWATAKHVAYKEIVVDGNLDPGGYSLKKEYTISPPPELQYLELSTIREADRNRTVQKLMDFHSITI